MNLRPLELAELRAADGLASEEEQASLREAGMDPAAWLPLRGALRELLMSPDRPELVQGVLEALELEGGPQLEAWEGPPPDLAADVLARLGLQGAELELGVEGDSPELVADVMAALGLEPAQLPLAAGHPAPELAASVLAQLGLSSAALDLGPDHEAPELGAEVLAALSLHGVELPSLGAESPVELAPAVMAELGQHRMPVREVLRPLSSPPLWDAVAEELHIDRPAAEPLPANRPMPAARSHFWASLGVALAAAAAMLIGLFPEAPEAGFMLAAHNDLQIVELQTGDDVIATVLSSEEEGGPTIIFVEELAEPSAEPGATL